MATRSGVVAGVVGGFDTSVVATFRVAALMAVALSVVAPH
jgi:hypothetical protein